LFALTLVICAIAANARFYFEIIGRSPSFRSSLVKYNGVREAAKKTCNQNPAVIFYDADIKTQDYYLLKSTGASLVPGVDTMLKANQEVLMLQQIENRVFEKDIKQDSGAKAPLENAACLRYHADGSITYATKGS